MYTPKIQQLKEIAGKLQVAEDRWQFVIDAIGIGSWEINVNNGDAGWDARTAKILGLTDDICEGSVDLLTKYVLIDDITELYRQLATVKEGSADQISVLLRVNIPGYCARAEFRGKLRSTDTQQKIIGIVWLESECPRFEFCSTRLLLTKVK